MTAPATTITPVAERRASRGLWSDAVRAGCCATSPRCWACVHRPVRQRRGLRAGHRAVRPARGRPRTGCSAALAPSTSWARTFQGRDQFSRILYGAQISLVGRASVAVVMALIFGVLLGALAGGLGGRVDAVLMRST